MMKPMCTSRWLMGGLCAGLLSLAACATSDGGIATVRGNVLDPDLVSSGTRIEAAGTGASAAGIIVRVRDTAVTDETDALGFFELSGAIAGEITIEFVRDNHPIAAAERVIVPVDAEVTLKDVTLLDGVAAPEEIELDNVIAVVVETPVCNADGSGSFMLRDDGDLTFLVSVSAETVITDTRGEIACADVTQESQVKFRGIQDAGLVEATDLRVLKRGRRDLVP